MNAEAPNMIEEALKLTRAGFAVFPCFEVGSDLVCRCPKGEACKSAGKHPRTADGVKSATRDEQQIRTWWTQWPEANIGAATGEPSGVDVIDLDAAKNGPENFDALAKANGELPDSWLARTGGGGLHLFFRTAKLISRADSLAPGVDVRGPGGYVIAPPSLHRSGTRYTWAEGYAPWERPLADPPAWVVEFGRKQKRATITAAPASGPTDDQIDEPEVWSRLASDSTHGAAVARMRTGVALFPAGTHDAEIWKLLSWLRFKLPDVSDATLLRLLQPSVEAMNCPDHGLAHVAGKLAKVNGEHAARVEHERAANAAVQAAFGQKQQPAQAPQLATYQQTDLGNAERFRDRHGADLRYVLRRGWLVWDGTRFKLDESGAVKRLAHETVRAMKHEAADATDRDLGAKLFSHANRSEARRGIDNMEAIARDLLTYPAEAFDADPYALNVANGTLDLKTGKLRPHRREDLITMLAPVALDLLAGRPRFDGFLKRIIPDAEMRDFLRRVLGYCLTGDVSEQILLFFQGGGSNGKSTLVGLIQKILGDYACKAAPNFLLSKPGESHPTELADLEGRRLAISEETEKGRYLNEPRVKELTGGDRIRARRMNQDFYEFNSTSKIILVSNPKPRIRGADYGIRRRIKLVPFTQKISGSEVDPHLPEALWAEAPGILAWMVQGCLEWQRDGLKFPAAVQEATVHYQEEQDRLGDFIADRCDLVSGVWESSAVLFRAWESWCLARNEDAGTQRAFSEDLAEREGITDHRKNTGRGFIGIRLKKPSATVAQPSKEIAA